VRNGRLPIARTNSLIGREDSLFVELFSLLARLGKYLQSGCGTAVFDADIVSVASKTADFPVKLPVYREFGWRPARSVLRRQPSSLAFSDSLQPARHRPENPRGVFRFRLCLQTPDLSITGEELSKVSRPVREYSHFRETIGGDEFDRDCRQKMAVRIAHTHLAL
jgi:hypothetical protein